MFSVLFCESMDEPDTPFCHSSAPRVRRNDLFEEYWEDAGGKQTGNLKYSGALLTQTLSTQRP